MRLRIITEDVSFICTLGPEARTDRDTGAPKVDRETNVPLFQVQVAALDDSGGEVLKVSVPGRPDVTVGSPVAVENLVAIPWQQKDRSGVAYRATAIKPLGPPNLTAVPTPGPGEGPGPDRSSEGSSDRPSGRKAS